MVLILMLTETHPRRPLDECWVVVFRLQSLCHFEYISWQIGKLATLFFTQNILRNELRNALRMDTVLIES